MVDCAFLALLCAAMAREILAGKNMRNLRVLVVVSPPFAANVFFHVEAHLTGDASHGRRFALAVLIALLMLIGGRVVPQPATPFCNAVAKAGCPIHSAGSTVSASALSAATLVGWIVAPDSKGVGVALIAAAQLPEFRPAGALGG